LDPDSPTGFLYIGIVVQAIFVVTVFAGYLPYIICCFVVPVCVFGFALSISAPPPPPLFRIRGWSQELEYELMMVFPQKHKYLYYFSGPGVLTIGNSPREAGAGLHCYF
jgi:hypothetical protein